MKVITMKKLILLYLAIFAIPVFSEVFRDEKRSFIYERGGMDKILQQTWRK